LPEYDIPVRIRAADTYLQGENNTCLFSLKKNECEQ